MVANTDDRQPFYISDVKISHTDKYTYLGSHISIQSMAQLNLIHKVRIRANLDESPLGRALTLAMHAES